MISSEDFCFNNEDLIGRPISKTFPWANYWSSYAFTDDNEQIYGYMLVKSAEQQDECKKILMSIQG